jgi:hypothetical protein
MSLSLNKHPFDPQDDWIEVWSGIGLDGDNPVSCTVSICDSDYGEGRLWRQVEITPQVILPEEAEQIIREYGFPENFDNWDAPNDNTWKGIIDAAELI